MWDFVTFHNLFIPYSVICMYLKDLSDYNLTALKIIKQQFLTSYRFVKVQNAIETFFGLEIFFFLFVVLEMLLKAFYHWATTLDLGI
jgi:hypothetical protein